MDQWYKLYEVLMNHRRGNETEYIVAIALSLFAIVYVTYSSAVVGDSLLHHIFILFSILLGNRKALHLHTITLYSQC